MSSINVLTVLDRLAVMVTRQQPRETLAKNLKYLMQVHGNLSTHQLAKKSGVSQRSIVNILNQETSPSLDNVAKLASCFRLNLWHMIMPSLPDDLNSGALEKLVDAYHKAGPEGRRHITSVAEREAEYSTKDK